MELFVINRYTGDEPAEEGPSNEEQLKKKLLKKIQKRKRQSELHETEQDEVKPKKRKDTSEFTENENIEPTSGEDNSNEVQLKKDKSKKKKKKSKTETTETEIPCNNNTAEVDKEEDETGKTNGFTILGNFQMSKKDKVKRKLPTWLAHPSVVSVDLKNLTCSVDSIPELDNIFVEKLKENNINYFFPVQSQVIPWLLKNSHKPSRYWPNDICVSAPTGSGKTLAFVLPILQILHKRVVPKIQALVVLPVQDLANQVFQVFETYNVSKNLNILLLSKKRPFEEEQSLICKSDGIGSYKTMVDIIVTTPGRLVDHLTKTKGLCLRYLKYLVIDEADRVMENVQNDWLYHLNKHINADCKRSYQIPVISYSNLVTRNRPPNKLLFSATLSQDPEKLQQLGLFQPKLFTSIVKNNTSSENDLNDDSKFIGKYTTPAELTEFYVNVSKANKPVVLHHLLKSKSWKNVLCFVNSAEATSRLAYVLDAISGKEAKIGELSANLTVKKRNSVLKKFARGEIDVLVSSDALARGIDISNVEYVISYDAPKFIKTYIHRIGRTGRAGKEGSSVVFLTPKEKSEFKKMIETAGKTSVKEMEFDENELEKYQEAYGDALKSLRSRLEKEKQKRVLKVKSKKKLHKQISKGKYNNGFKKKPKIKRKIKIKKS